MLWGLFAVCTSVALAWQTRRVPYLGACALNLAALVQLWWPLWRADSVHESTAQLGLALNGASRALKVAALWALITTPPWLLCAWYVFCKDGAQSFVEAVLLLVHHECANNGIARTCALAARAVLMQLCGVALVEEVFWRGYVQPVCAARWPKRWPLSLPAGAYVSTGLFALVHLLEDGSIARMATFFPGLTFALLRTRTPTLCGAVFLHAWDNLAAQLLVRAAAAR